MLSESTLLLTNKSILNKIKELGDCISKDYAEQEVVVLCIIKGAMVFCSHLMSHINADVYLDCIDVSRYGSRLEGGELVVKSNPTLNLTNRNLLIVDDMIDQGETLQFVQNYCVNQGAASIKTAVLLQKEHNRKISTEVPIDYCAFTIPDAFVFGFGIDCKGRYRNLPDIYALNQ